MVFSVRRVVTGVDADGQRVASLIRNVEPGADEVVLR